jgi:Protein of unknown function (DUF3592)
VTTVFRTYLALASAGCFLGAIVLGWQRLSAVFLGATATGRVVGFSSREDDGTTCFLPVVTFEDVEGRSHQFTSPAGSARKHPPIGAEVTVRYQRANPSTAYIASFLHMWAAPVALALLGAAALAAYLQ